MNDFREYSAAFHDHQNDLAHYGVKGMKWKHHKRSLREWLYGGDSQENEEIARRKANKKRREYANEVGYRDDQLLETTGLGVARLNSYDPDKERRMDNLIAYDNKRKRSDSLNKLDSEYYRAQAKAKIAKNDSVVGKAKRNFGALKDTIKSISLKDYTDFYGNLFKKKKKK